MKDTSCESYDALSDEPAVVMSQIPAVLDEPYMIHQKNFSVSFNFFYSLFLLFSFSMPGKSTSKTHDYLEEMVCPITHELPVNPVIAEDGRVYESKAWEKYLKVNAKSKSKIKSPWTQKMISKKAYPSTAIKQLIEHAVRNKHVRREMCHTWNESFKKEHELLRIKADANKKPCLFMKLGDYYSNGTDLVSRDLQTAYMYYEKGWTQTSDKTFFLRMMMLNTLRPERTRTGVICAWSSICQLVDNEMAAYVIRTTLRKLPAILMTSVARMSNVEHVLESASDPPPHCENDCIPDECAVEIAGFLKQNASTFDSDDSDDSDSDDSNSDDEEGDEDDDEDDDDDDNDDDDNDDDNEEDDD